jgi:hypothetical protein
VPLGVGFDDSFPRLGVGFDETLVFSGCDIRVMVIIYHKSRTERRQKMQKVTKTQDSHHLLKANPEIGYRITSGQMSFLGRKVYNSLIYRAQQAGIAGKGKLPHAVSYDLAALVPIENYWWIPLSDVVDDAAVGDRNHSRIKAYLRALMSVVVERNAVGWEADHIIDKARIVGTATPEGKRGDKLLVGWYFPPELEAMLIAPDQYTRLSLYYQSLLKTEAALVLYEICKRYSTNPSKVTLKMSWQEWQERLMTSRRDEYKFFKRDFLAPAIKEVNAITDIDITLVEKRAETRGKPIESIQFVVEPKVQLGLELPAGPVFPEGLLEKLEGLGISPVAAEKLLSVHGEEKVSAAMSHVFERLENTKLPALASPAAYFKKALAEDFAGGEAALKKARERQKKAGETAAAARRAASAGLVFDAAPAAALPEGEALAVAWAEFRVSPAADPVRLGKQLPESFEKAKKAAQAAFKVWLAAKAV